ncbi:MAG: ABC transporter substrate-binding protein [Polyangiaceae bacterium]
MRPSAIGFALAALLSSPMWTAAVPSAALGLNTVPISRVASGPFPKTAIGAFGHAAVLAAPPQRIVSLALSADEDLLELVAPDRVVGLTRFIDNPTLTLSASRAPVGAARLTENDPESILRLDPDLVVAAAYTRIETIGLLQAAGIPVIQIGELATLDDIVSAMASLGEAVGESLRAHTLIDAMRAREARVASRPRPDRPARILVWDHGYTRGAGTLTDDILHRIGAVNAAAQLGLKGYAAIVGESALALAPDVVLVPSAEPAVRFRAVDLVATDPVWSLVPAVQAGRVVGVPRVRLDSVSVHAFAALETIAEVVDGQEP